jgi:8-oxo-dGTP diphosphatase
MSKAGGILLVCRHVRVSLSTFVINREPERKLSGDPFLCYLSNMKLQVGVKVLLRNSKGLYLLIQRSKAFSDGTEWDIPGGRIKPSELLGDALAREIQEEIGVTLSSSLQLIKAKDIMVPDINLHVVRLTYTAQFDGAITLSHEHRSFKWVTKQEALAMNIDPNLAEILETI